MKYIIDIPNEDVGRWIRGTPSGMKLLVPISIEDGKEYHIKTDISAQNYSELYQEDIENKVWELADYMCKMSSTERTLCFAFEYPSEVTTNFTFQEAKALFEKWMNSENEIHVGDEVTDVDGVKGIITYVHNGLCDVLWNDGSVNEDRDRDELFKTGRHFPEVPELLEKMKG